ncbi:tail fiber protein [Microbacterium sp. LMI12-1-1.1]
MKLSFDGVASSLIVGTEKNATSFVIKTRPRGTETWTQRAAGNDVLNVSYWVSASGFPVDTAYEARVELSDKLGTVAAVTFVSKAGILLDWGNGTMGVGKEWVQGTLDVEGDTYTSGKFDGASAVIAGSITHRAGATVEPAGMVSMFAGSTAPTGWLLCQGQAVSRTTYAALFAAIGTTYGVGNGSSTFNLPDLRGRVPIGSGTGTAGSATAHPLGQNGGQETHTHTEGDMSAAIGASNGNTNQMSYQAVDRNGRGPATSGAYTMFGNGANSTAYGWNHYTKVYGTTAAGDSMQPFLTLNFIIKT